MRLVSPTRAALVAGAVTAAAGAAMASRTLGRGRIATLSSPELRELAVNRPASRKKSQ
jgi:hypothetical protein